MRFPPTGAWAKLSPRRVPTDWHPLVDHCHDVAAAFEALLSLPAVHRAMSALAGGEGLGTGWRDRLTVLAFLHDFGKANVAFQEQRGGHIDEALYPWRHPATCAAALLDRLDIFGSEPDQMIVTALAHHGEAPSRPTELTHAQRVPWLASASLDPIAEVAGLVEAAARCWPAAFAPDATPLPAETRFWHGFLGLLQLADWLGSDSRPDGFPFTREGESGRRVFAAERSARLLREIGLDVSVLREGRSTPDFANVSAHRPTQIQEMVARAPGPVVVMEAETGSGKTEAALYRFALLFMSGAVDGLYFALPTRVAASQMFDRVKTAIARLFPGEDRRPVIVRAVPGDAGADAARVRSLPDFDVEWSDDPNEAERRRRWAAEGPKRFLAATIAVGTIDQALLGAVKVKHAQMRSLCLSRSLLVVDEVHASDTYMARLLTNLLDQHMRAGGEALLLSATLGSAARTELMLNSILPPRHVKRQMPDLPHASAVAYPSVSTLEAGRIVTRRAASRGAGKTVRMEPLHAIADPDTVARAALDAAQAGARVLLVRNTVGDAIETRRHLEALAPGEAVQFAVEGRPTLHHGRFAREDRRRLDAAVEARLGIDAPRDHGLVVVGTQTLEISLDIDADLMITDLCPIDVLLQRLGRLHRHGRPRPQGFEAPRCLVLVPADFSDALATIKRERPGGPHGLGTVYPNLPSLAATRRLIGEGAEFRIPAMNRALVEAATHPEALQAIVDELSRADPRWADATLRKEGETYAERGAAERARLEWEKPVSAFHLDEGAATRLGARNVELVFDPMPTGAFGASVSRLVVPDHLNPSKAFEAVDIVQGVDGFAFRLSESLFLYDSFGLRLTGESQPKP